MGAYAGVQNLFNKPVLDVAISLGYREDNLLILKGDEDGLKLRHPKTYENLLSCKHHADRRSPLEYGQDLVASWIFEDTFLLALKHSKTFSVILDGADKNRQILSNVQTSSSSDYLIQGARGYTRKLELMTDYTGYWTRFGKLHLRDSKYDSLKASKSIFVAVSTVTKDFTLYDFEAPIPAVYIPSHPPYGGKSAYELKISKEKMIPYTSKQLINTLSSILQ